MDDAAAADDRISTTQAGAETREGIRLLPDVWIIDLPTIAPGAGSGVGAVREGGVLEWCGGGGSFERPTRGVRCAEGRSPELREACSLGCPRREHVGGEFRGTNLNMRPT
jgi:hypothetical protein